MNLLVRRITYITFILIFLILAPIVVLYTQGYRYNFQHGRIQKTGILIISSDPKKASIYLNGLIAKDDATPARLEEMLPGDYEIKLIKDGYHSWQKRLPIYENSTTFAEDVLLWKNNLPILISDQKISFEQSSFDRQKMVFVSQTGNVNYIDLSNNEIIPVNEVTEPATQLLGWSNTSKKIIIQAGERYQIVNLDNLNIQPVQLTSSYLPSAPQKVKWDLTNDNIIYSSNDSGIWQTDIFQQNHALIYSADDILDFIVIDKNAYILKADGLYKKELADGSPSTVLTKLKCPGCAFVNHDAKKLVLLDQDRQTLYIIDPDGYTETVSAKAKNISWLKNDTILLYNDWELWIYEFKKRTPELVTRLGQPIQQALWHHNGRHIIYASENKIRVIELDNRELRNVIELASLNQINSLTIDGQGENLYFSGELAKQKGIFKLEIR